MSWTIGGKTLDSRLLIGSALYSSPEEMTGSIKESGSEIVTVSLRRQNPGEGQGEKFWEQIKDLGLNILPNTAGCRTVKEAVTTAHMAREIFDTSWIKLEVIGDDYTLQPDGIALVEAARILNEDGFTVFPYSTEDLIIAQRLVDCGCDIVMPWASPIGSGQGLLNEFGLRTLRKRLPDTTLIVDAGLGRPSDAAQVMELGFDGALVNSAIALSDNPVKMGSAFAQAVKAGRAGFEAGVMHKRDMASPSTPTLGTPFWHEDQRID